jgi:predicted dehydrogenase
MIGFIGCGQIFSDGYLPALDYLNIKDVIVYDESEESINQAIKSTAKLNNIELRTAKSVNELINYANKIIVLVPPKEVLSIIHEISKLSNCSYVSLLIEKPLGVSENEAKEITLLCSKSSISLNYMEVFIHSSTTDVLLEELSLRRHGDIKRIMMQFKGSTPKNIQNQWRGSRLTGGLVWHDWGIHSLGLLLPILSYCNINLPRLDEIEVTDSRWMSKGENNILTESRASWSVDNVEVSVLATWEQGGNPDMRIDFEDNSAFELIIGKKNGTSMWTLNEKNMISLNPLVTSRYPKERFIRGVRSFLVEDRQWAFDPQIAIKSLRIADYAYQLSKKSLTNETSND